MKSVEVIVDTDGNIKVEAVGFVGHACDLATKAFVDAMGKSKGSVKKKEWFQTDSNTQAIGK